MKLTLKFSGLIQLISLLILFVLPEIGMSQDSQEIDSCTSAETVDHDKAMDFYFKHNINISSYDWSNTNANCHIALGYKYNAQRNILRGSGIATLCVGALIFTSGMVGRDVAAPEKELDTHNAAIYAGAGLCLGGVLLLHLSHKHKWDINYHMREVEYYFRD